MSVETAVNGVSGTEEQPDNVDDVNSKKTVKYDSGAADLEKVTDYAEEKEVISTDDISGVSCILSVVLFLEVIIICMSRYRR